MSRIDLLLLLMVVIWGANFTVLKVALVDLPPLAFNSLRLLVASLIFMALISLRGFRVPRKDLLWIAALGVIGHFAYQLCFLGGIARTSVANSALIIGTSPISVALLTAVAGHERVTGRHGMGAALSVVGIYLLVGHDAELSRETLIGDLLIMLANVCWAVYTVGARSLLKRHSALVVTGYSMMVGTVLYVVVGFPEVARQNWRAVHASAWLALVFSSVLALNVAYLIWYTAVQRLGNIRTSMYSNIVPIVAMLVAVAWLGERVGVNKLVGASAILSGLAITRVGRAAADSAAPIEG